MAALEVTIISLALPLMQDSFAGVETATLSWVFTAYSIGIASLLLLSGWAADLFGRKRLFLTGMVVFALGSLGSGAAQSVAWLIAGRVVQAAGGAMLFPAGLALVLAVFPAAKRQMAIGIWAAIGGLAGAVAPSLGALLINIFGWRSVFLINVPVAIVATVAGSLVLHESRAETASRRVDMVGVPCASFGVGILVLGVTQGREWGWASPAVIGSLTASVGLITFFVFRSRRHSAPLFDLSLFAIRSYRVALIGALLFSSAFFGSWVLLPTFIQRWWHWSVLETGLAVMPSSIISAVLAAPIGLVVDRFGHRWMVALGGLFGAVAMAGFALFMTPEPRLWVGLLLPSVFLGLSMAILFAMLVGAAMREVPPERYGMAGAGRTTSFQLAQAVGVAVGVAVVGQPLTADAAMSSYRLNWWISAALFAALFVLFLVAYPSPRRSRP